MLGGSGGHSGRRRRWIAHGTAGTLRGRGAGCAGGATATRRFAPQPTENSAKETKATRGRNRRRITISAALGVWRLPGSNAGFQFAGSFGQFFRNFAKKLRCAFFGFGSDFFFNVFAEAGYFFIQAAAEFFKFVHKVARRYARRDSGIIGTQEKWLQGGVLAASLSLADARGALEKNVWRDVWRRRATDRQLCPACGSLVGINATRCHACGTNLRFGLAAWSKGLMRNFSAGTRR